MPPFPTTTTRRACRSRQQMSSTVCAPCQDWGRVFPLRSAHWRAPQCHAHPIHAGDRTGRGDERPSIHKASHSAAPCLLHGIAVRPDACARTAPRTRLQESPHERPHPLHPPRPASPPHLGTPPRVTAAGCVGAPVKHVHARIARQASPFLHVEALNIVRDAYQIRDLPSRCMHDGKHWVRQARRVPQAALPPYPPPSAPVRPTRA